MSVTNRDANSPAIFIPREIGEWQFVILRGSEKLKHIPRVSGNFGENFVSDLKSIYNFFLLKRFFMEIFSLNQKNDMIFMIRNDKIAGN